MTLRLYGGRQCPPPRAALPGPWGLKEDAADTAVGMLPRTQPELQKHLVPSASQGSTSCCFSGAQLSKGVGGCGPWCRGGVRASAAPHAPAGPGKREAPSAGRGSPGADGGAGSALHCGPAPARSPGGEAFSRRTRAQNVPPSCRGSCAPAHLGSRTSSLPFLAAVGASRGRRPSWEKPGSRRTERTSTVAGFRNKQGRFPGKSEAQTKQQTIFRYKHAPCDIWGRS